MQERLNPASSRQPDISEIPGLAFTNLLLSIEDENSLLGYKIFLSSLVAEEIKMLLSTSYFPKARHMQQNKSGSILSSVPALIEELHRGPNHVLKDSLACKSIYTFL